MPPVPLHGPLTRECIDAHIDLQLRWLLPRAAALRSFTVRTQKLCDLDPCPSIGRPIPDQTVVLAFWVRLWRFPSLPQETLRCVACRLRHALRKLLPQAVLKSAHAFTLFSRVVQWNPNTSNLCYTLQGVFAADLSHKLFGALSKATALKKLDLGSIWPQSALQALQQLPNSLTSLQIGLLWTTSNAAIAVAALPAVFYRLPRLKDISLRLEILPSHGAPQLKDGSSIMESLAGCPALQRIFVDVQTHGGTGKFGEIGLPASLASLTDLRHLELRGCGVNNLPASIGKLTHLTQLTLAAGPGPRNVVNLCRLPASFTALRSLACLNARPSLQDASMLRSLPGLTSVLLYYARGIPKPDFLQ